MTSEATASIHFGIACSLSLSCLPSGARLGRVLTGRVITALTSARLYGKMLETSLQILHTVYKLEDHD